MRKIWMSRLTSPFLLPRSFLRLATGELIRRQISIADSVNSVYARLSSSVKSSDGASDSTQISSERNFLEEQAFRRQQAHKSVLVQVSSVHAVDALQQQCAAHGKVDAIFHYIHQEKVWKCFRVLLNFLLIFLIV